MATISRSCRAGCALISTIVTLLLLDPSALRAERPRVYAISGGTLHAAPGRTVDNATVVVRDGLIESIGTDSAAPPDAVVIDASGHRIYPGLIDADSRLRPLVERGAGGGDSLVIHRLAIVVGLIPLANWRRSGRREAPERTDAELPTT